MTLQTLMTDRTKSSDNTATHLQSKPAAASRPTKVLIVEDQYLIAVLIEETLKAAGMDCIGMAAKASEAIDMCERNRPDFVTMDLNLAESESGEDLARALFDRFELRCLIVSAYIDRKTEQRYEPLNPLGFLAKPFHIDELYMALKDTAEKLDAI